jgi:hypothetical protein
VENIHAHRQPFLKRLHEEMPRLVRLRDSEQTGRFVGGARCENPMKVRGIFWTGAMAYTGFLLTGQGLRTFNSLSVTEGLLGALTGFLLAMMFTLRERRRRRPAFIAQSIPQIMPNWGIPAENGRSRSKVKD